MKITYQQDSIQAWLICLFATCYFFYVIVDATLFNIISPQLLQTFNLSSTGLGTFSSVYLIANAVWLIPAGLLYDKLSTKKIILLTFSLCILATFCFALSTSITIDVISRFISGMSGAFAFLGTLRLAAHWFLNKKIGLVISIVITLGMSGGIFTNTLFSLLIDHIGWRHGLLAQGGLGILFLLLILFFVHDAPSNNQHHDAQPVSLHLWQKITTILHNKQNWLVGGFTGLLNLPIMMFATLWASLFLTQNYAFTMTQAASITSMVFFGEIIGSPIMGWITHHLRSRKMPLYFGAIFSLIIMLIIIFLPQLSLTNLLILFFILGFCVSAQVVGYAIVVDSNSLNNISTAQGFTSTLVNLASAIAKPLFGWLLALHWNGRLQAGIPFYSKANYQLALLLLPICFFIALIFCKLLKETHK